MRRAAIIAALGLSGIVSVWPAISTGSPTPARCHTKACWKRTCVSVRCRARVREKAWRRARWRLSPATRGMLARLRWCESTNNYRASNGTHWGAYQYSWGPGSAGARAGFRVRPDFASPAEQDVRTARFYPSHRGEWACRA